MKKDLVRCYIHNNYRIAGSTPDILYITYPDCNLGHTLLSCMNCGEIYAVDIQAETYADISLANKLSSLKCVKCGLTLSDVCKPYPETYTKDGVEIQFERPTLYPDNEPSITREFYAIYGN